jgi:hypothetical protein
MNTYSFKFNNNSNNILISNQMIPSLDAHKSCRPRNTLPRIKLKPQRKPILLVALLAMLMMGTTVRAQDDSSIDNPDESGGAASSGGTTQIKTATSLTSPYAKGQLKLRIDAIEPEAGPTSGKAHNLIMACNR